MVPNPNLNGGSGLKGIYLRLQVKPTFAHAYGSVPLNSRAHWPTAAAPEPGGGGLQVATLLPAFGGERKDKKPQWSGKGRSSQLAGGSNCCYAACFAAAGRASAWHMGPLASAT